MDPSTTKEGRIYSDLCRCFPTTPRRVNKYIYVMYVYDCNAILTTAMNNRGDKGMIRAFTSLTEDLKIWGINPGFHFMDNEAYTALKLTMTSMNIRYQLVPPSNHRSNHSERAIQTFKNHFIAWLCRVDKYFHLRFWYIILHQAKIGLNLLCQSITLPQSSAYIHISGEFDFNRKP